MHLPEVRALPFIFSTELSLFKDHSLFEAMQIILPGYWHFLMPELFNFPKQLKS